MRSTDQLTKEQKKANFARKMKLLELYGACMENAGRFIDEAKLLLKHQAFPRAAFLAYCGIEETGKAQIVADFFNGDITEEEFKKFYYSHPVKAAYPVRTVQLTGRAISEEVTLVDTFSMHVDSLMGARLREYREPALYVGFDDDFNPIRPDERLSGEEADAIVEKAYGSWRHILEMDAFTEGIGARGHFK
jgi:AbiV family abortive infection protein